jgi:FtsZ-binding cell division protein ZapB
MRQQLIYACSMLLIFPWQAAALNDKLSREAVTLREERSQLMVVVDTAGSQVEAMQQDLRRVRDQHRSLQARLRSEGDGAVDSQLHSCKLPCQC